MCSNMASSRQKRALESTSRSGEGGQRPSKRPNPITSNLQNSQINAFPGHFTSDDNRQAVREELREQANSDQMEPFDSCIQDALMRFIPQIDSLLKNGIRKLVREEIEQAISKVTEHFESCIQNELKGIIPQIDSSLKNAFQERVCKGTDHPIPYSSKPDTSTLPNSTKITDTRNLKLRFSSKLSLPVYTQPPLKSEGESPIQVELIDANTDSVVTSGPESCAKLDVVVLRGDFDNEGNDTWSVKEFEGCMVNERKGKAPLLTGNLTVKLKEGKAKLDDLSFTDNSSWISSKMFKIGVRVASGFCEGIRVREAITEAFSVIHRRGEAYEKHYPPKSDDDIWRLEKIAKTGEYCKRLNDAGIYKVKDFMRILFAEPEKLQKILKMKSQKKWIDLEAHAKTCEADGKSYEYYDDPKVFGVVISNFCQLQGFITDGIYHSAELLLDHQKALAGDLVKAAGMNWMRVKVFDPNIYSSSILGKSLPTCPIELSKEQHLCGGPSDCRLTPLSVPKTQTSKVPWGSSVPMSDTTDHGVGINPQSSTQSHPTNSTASFRLEKDTNRWNQQVTSGHENVQSPEPRGSSTFGEHESFWEELDPLPERSNTSLSSTIPEQDTNRCNQEETFENENVEFTDPYESWERIMEDLEEFPPNFGENNHD